MLRVPLRDEDLGVALPGDALQRFCSLPDHKSDHPIRDLELRDLAFRRLRIKWVRVADMHLDVRIRYLRLVIDNLVIPHDFIYHVLGLSILVVRSFHKDVPHAR